MKKELTVELLCKEASIFIEAESAHAEPSLFGVTDGKAVGTYLEHKFQSYLHEKYNYEEGSSAKGIDFPKLGVDIKVTSIKQPQSSCPFKNARQKIFGLGYSLLLFVYEKTDEQQTRTAKLNILHNIYIEADKTADYQITTGILNIIENNGNKDDIVAFMQDHLLPVEEIQALQIAEEIIENPPKIGYLTISNALQWRLQYNRVIKEAGKVDGIQRIR
ncbi:MAG: hypothetical protein JXM79_02575 [Sedimentisphaerales bacterium]|nr:hypothetical protein [Sedimentisphaerales bacterium]